MSLPTQRPAVKPAVCPFKLPLHRFSTRKLINAIFVVEAVRVDRWQETVDPADPILAQLEETLVDLRTELRRREEAAW